MDEQRDLYVRDDSQLFNDDDSSVSGPPPMAGNFLVTLLAFFFIGSCCAAVLLIIRRRRQTRRDALLPIHCQPSHHRHSTLATESDFVKPSSTHKWEENNLIAGASSPGSPTPHIPELRLTFPDEEGDKEKGGRVVVVSVSDSGSIGMAPLMQDTLPPYQTSDSGRFHSLDLCRIGGLKERDQASQ